MSEQWRNLDEVGAEIMDRYFNDPDHQTGTLLASRRVGHVVLLWFCGGGYPDYHVVFSHRVGESSVLQGASSFLFDGLPAPAPILEALSYQIWDDVQLDVVHLWISSATTAKLTVDGQQDSVLDAGRHMPLIIAMDRTRAPHLLRLHSAVDRTLLGSIVVMNE